MAWSLATSAANQSRKDYFDFRVREAIGHINQRMQAYKQVLLGARGLYEASVSVERHEFRDYVASLHLADTYPGIQGVGFSLIVPAAEKDRHVATIRKEGFPDYNIRPEGKRDPYTSIIYLEPLSGRNLRAFSYDMYSEPVRRAAMERARDTGEAAMSGRVRLVQEDGKQEQSGFLMYVPVYRNGVPHGTLTERRANIIGWVYAPFRMNDLMQGTQGEHAGDLGIEIYDGREMKESELMYDSIAGKHVHTMMQDSSVHAVNTIEIAGYPWTVHVHGQPVLSGRVAQNRPQLVATIGLVASLLVTWLVWLLVTGRERAMAAAQRMNHELIEAKAGLSSALEEALRAEKGLRESEVKYRALVETTGTGYLIVDHQGRVVDANAEYVRLTGYQQLGEILGRSVVEWTAPHEKQKNADAVARCISDRGIRNLEIDYLWSDGQIVPIEINATVQGEGESLQIISLCRDITERKHQEQIIRAKEQILYDILNTSPVAVRISTQQGRNVKFYNRSYTELIGNPQPLGDNPRNYYVRPEDYDAVVAEISQGRSVISREIELHALGRERIWVLASYMLVQFQGEDAVLGWFYDITERKLAEEKLLKLSRAVENSPASVVITDTKGTIEYVNSKFVAVTGYSVEEAIGQNPRVLKSGRHPEKFYKDLWETITSGREWRGEIVNKKKNGEQYTEQVSISPVRNDEGEIINFVAVKEDVTNRRQMERQLRQSEEKFHTLFDSSRDALMLLDEKGFFDCNIATLEMFGCATKEEFCSKHPADLSPPVQDCGTDSMALASQKIAVALEKGSNFFEWTHRRVDTGEAFPADVLLTRMELGARQVLQATVRNTTERKRIEQILRESEERWSFALEGSGDGVWDWDLQTGEVSLSKAGAVMFGYEEGEIKNNITFWHAQLHPNDVAQWDEVLRNFFRSKSDKFSLEYRVRCKDGSYKWILTRGMVVSRFPDGKVLRMIGVHTDTHQRKVAEERLALFKRIFDASERAIGIADGNGQMIYINPAFEHMYGYLLEEIAGKNISIFLPESSLDRTQEILETTARGENWSGLLQQQRKDGSVFISASSIGAILDEQGKHRYLFNILYDYTPELERQEELSIARDRADTANRSKSEFLSNMSHEIRTPMNAIIGLSNLCLQTDLTPRQQDYLRKVHNSANSLLGIINDILDFSKIEAGKLGMEAVPFELETVLDSMATIVAVKAEERGLEFLPEVSLGVPPSLIGDPLRLGQILINLAGNAIKFTEKGEVLVLAELEEETVDCAILRFTVADTGIGMTEEQIGRLFQAFSQADTTITRKFGGTGLGLSISKRLVEMMGGRIWVESAPGKGSKFIFTARFQKAARMAREPAALPGDLRGMNVLAVDDNKSALHILQSYLESYAFNVATASNGSEALEVIRKAGTGNKHIDLVVADWKMPEMDGIELARKLHESHDLGKRPKVLLISSFGQSEMLKHLNEGMVDGVLAKPFQQSQLFSAVMDVFGSGKASGLKKLSQALFDPALTAKISGAYLLLAEDNEINQQVARELLEMAGVAVAVAETGKEALELLQKEKFDGVLMDMQMPVMDGIAATKEIRKLPQFAGLPIIAMTANVMGGDREVCLAAGMNDYIAKPIDPGRMAETLAKWITPAQPMAHPAAPEEETVQKPEALPELPGVKVAEGVRRLGGNVEIYYGILEKFHASQQGVIAEIRAALSAGDSTAATRLAHTLKGLLGTLGAKALQDMAGELEPSIKAGNINEVLSLLPRLDVELSRLFGSIGSALRLYKEKRESTAATEPASPVNLEELAALVRKAKAQLEDFDSAAADSIAQMREITCSDKIMKKTVDVIARYTDNYDYEQSLIKLTVWAKSLGISLEKE